MATYQELRARSQQVRDEQNIGGNTALRVGQLLMDIVKHFNDNDAAASEYLQQHFAMVNDGTHLLNWQQSPIVILHTMGETYDEGDFSSLSQGENYYRAGFILEANGQGGGINGETPKANVLYVNLANDTLYTWNGSSFDAITSGGGGGSISGDDIIKNAYYSNGNLVLIIETEGGDKTVTIPVNFDASNYVPTSRTVNGKALSSNITLSQSDIPGLVAALAAKVGYSDDEWLQVKAGAMQAATAVPNTTTVNGKRLNDNIVIGMADIPGLLQAIANAGSGAVSVQQNADGSFSITVGNDTYVFDDYPTKQDMADAIDDALGEAQVTVVPTGSVGVISSLGSDSDEDALSASMGKKLKMAIITVLNSLGNYAFPDGKPVIDWGDDSPVTYTVSKTIGTGLSATGGDTDVALGDSLEVTIAITNNMYIVDDDSVVVTMGGQPVVSAWNASTMKVTIGTVTGNVVINVPSMTYVQRGLVLHLDGKNGRSVAHRWDSLVNYNSNPLYFKLENCDESNSNYVAGNGTNSKGTAFSDSALTMPVTLLDVGALQGTIEAAYNGAEYNANGNLGIMHNGIGSGNRLCLMSYTAENGPLIIESTVPILTTSGTSARMNTGTKTLLENGGSLSCMYGSFRMNGNDFDVIGTAAQNTDSNSRLSIFWRKTTNENFFKLNLFALRVYSVQLTDAERAQNLAIDQKRFNLS